MRWSDGFGGMFLVFAAMLAIVVFLLPLFESQRALIAAVAILPAAVIGTVVIFYGRS
jgi:multidrug efflux pump subunit AcrB